MAKLETIRAFVAINLSLESTRAVAALARELRADLEPLPLKVSWVVPANLHQTVKFLGDIDPEMVEAIRAGLVQAAAKVAPFPVEAQGLGAFPAPTKPRVLWVGLQDPQSGLAQVKRGVEEALEELGFKSDKRKFRTHLTVGRVRKGKQDLDEILAKYAERSCGISTVSELVLYESRLKRTGAEYTVLARAPLSGWGQSEEGPPASSAKDGDR